ncbi:DNA repair protein RecO [Glaciecola petra]|uniref:DNA repair protein RecO n=1 Tax=Glaciecola petra TaxID=3075602 RepID=A0ABU2ZWG5_9ALTE|nr:DNA repair protein RecO [Aestuariibacter sp. P117]MDT0596591.1 DNA repair protein RecO [Aestuariibacter sp. P117]
MKMQSILSGYVLHKRPYRETSMLVDFFSLEQGLIRTIVKGVRGNSKSDRKSLLQSFQKVEFTLAGRGQLKNLGRIESLNLRSNLIGNQLYCGMYINEVLSRCLPEAEPVSEIFDDYEQSLLSLSQVSTTQLSDIEPILRIFELNMLQTLGYLPDFSVEANTGEPILPELFYTFDAQSGFHLSHANAAMPYTGKVILDIADGKMSRDSTVVDRVDEQKASVDELILRRAAKQICRQAMRQLLGQKPLKSRELFIQG